MYLKIGLKGKGDWVKTGEVFIKNTKNQPRSQVVLPFNNAKLQKTWVRD